MALIDQATPLLALFLRMSATTGARRGEVCALRWDDVDLDARLVHIHRSVLQLTGNKVLIKDTKMAPRRHNALTWAFVVGRPGLEPGTLGLKVHPELSRRSAGVR